jgi:hypothetical protein
VFAAHVPRGVVGFLAIARHRGREAVSTHTHEAVLFACACVRSGRGRRRAGLGGSGVGRAPYRRPVRIRVSAGGGIVGSVCLWEGGGWAVRVGGCMCRIGALEPLSAHPVPGKAAPSAL